MPRALHQVGAVHARGADADQDLAVAGHRVGPLLDVECTFPDGSHAHSGMLRAMKLEGVHHVTCITGDAPGNVRFYVGELGLRMVKKTVNQDDPTRLPPLLRRRERLRRRRHHVLRVPGRAEGPRRGRDGAHRVVPRRLRGVARRSGRRASAARSRAARFASRIRRGSGSSSLVDDSGDPPLTANAPDIPEEHRIRGFAGVRAYAAHPEQSEHLLTSLGFTPGWEARGESRSGFYVYDPPPAERGLQAARDRAPRRVVVAA